ncbi:hypothetical protein Tco_0958472 [Tanacetum coccineum]
MDPYNYTTPTSTKLPILDTRKFKQWKFKIQQYLQHEHYALWEVIEFRDSYKAPPEETGCRLVPSCFVIFDLELLSLSFDFVFSSEIFKSLSLCLDCLCRLAILCLDQHAHTLHHIESLLTISLGRLDILKEDLVYKSLCGSLCL